MRVAITGGCGFIGHHLVEYLKNKTAWDIIIIDKLTYATNGLNRLRDIGGKGIKIYTFDLCQPLSVGLKQEIGSVDYIINLASESHVDHSIRDPRFFINNNIGLMVTVLEWAKDIKGLKKLLHFSTDEVYGTASDSEFSEGDRFNPGNPYSASKAAQECLCRAYANSYRVPVCMVNVMNVIGERQHPEKIIPLAVKAILAGKKIMIHGDAKMNPGKRHYIHAKKVAEAVYFILTNTSELLDKTDAARGKYHIAGEIELDNLSLAQMVAEILGKKLKYKIVDFPTTRPGHDFSYSICGRKLKEAGFNMPATIQSDIINTVRWFYNNRQWLEY